MRERLRRITSHNMMVNNSIAIFLLVCVTFGSQCGSNNHSEIKSLLDLPMKQQEETFRQFSLVKQVDVYVEAMYVEPPQTRYASYLASNGKKLLPVLIKKLQEQKSDTAKAYIVYSFKVMHEKYYSLSNEKDVLESLTAMINGMKDDYRRQQSEEYLKEILEKPKGHGWQRRSLRPRL